MFLSAQRPRLHLDLSDDGSECSVDMRSESPISSQSTVSNPDHCATDVCAQTHGRVSKEIGDRIAAACRTFTQQERQYLTLASKLRISPNSDLYDLFCRVCLTIPGVRAKVARFVGQDDGTAAEALAYEIKMDLQAASHNDTKFMSDIRMFHELRRSIIQARNFSSEVSRSITTAIHGHVQSCKTPKCKYSLFERVKQQPFYTATMLNELYSQVQCISAVLGCDHDNTNPTKCVIVSQWRCPNCVSLLRGPVITGCGHRFCKVCVDRLAGQDCLVCHREGALAPATVQRDMAVERFLLQHQKMQQSTFVHPATQPPSSAIVVEGDEEKHDVDTPMGDADGLGDSAPWGQHPDESCLTDMCPLRKISIDVSDVFPKFMRSEDRPMPDAQDAATPSREPSAFSQHIISTIHIPPAIMDSTILSDRPFKRAKTEHPETSVVCMLSPLPTLQETTERAQPSKPAPEPIAPPQEAQVPTPAPKPTVSKSLSCHQCKVKKARDELSFCCGKWRQPGRRKCRKKYCKGCLTKLYREPLSTSDEWKCPACRSMCVCALCLREHKGDSSAVKALLSNKRNNQNASCHQCKVSIPMEQLNLCANRKRKKAGVRRSYMCRKKYCNKCVSRYTQVDQINEDSWECPSCTKQCICKACGNSKHKVSTSKQ